MGRWLIGVGALLAALCGSALAEDTIRLGQTVALSGPLAELGIEYRDGALAYFNAVNEKGGVHGRKIKLISLDDGYVVARSEENARRLLKDEKVLAFFGPLGTANVAALLPIIDEQGVPTLAPYTGSDELRRFNRNIFWLRASYGDETEKIVEQLVSVGIKRIAAFYQNDAFGLSGLAGVEQALKKRNLTLAGKGSFERNTVDVAAAVQAIAAQDPQAVVLISTYKPTAAFVRAFKQTGKAAQLFTLSVVGFKALAAELGDDATGIAISQVVPFPWSATKPLVREFQKLPPNLMPASGATFTSLEGYMAAKVMVEALRRAGSHVTREKLVAALESMGEFDLGGLTVRYGPGNHIGSQYSELTIVGRDGKLFR